MITAINLIDRLLKRIEANEKVEDTVQLIKKCPNLCPGNIATDEIRRREEELVKGLVHFMQRSKDAAAAVTEYLNKQILICSDQMLMESIMTYICSMDGDRLHGFQQTMLSMDDLETIMQAEKKGLFPDSIAGQALDAALSEGHFRIIPYLLVKQAKYIEGSRQKNDN